jgi:hypothetical protein
MSNESHQVRELRRDAKRLVKAVVARDPVFIPKERRPASGMHVRSPCHDARLALDE